MAMERRDSRRYFQRLTGMRRFIYGANATATDESFIPAPLRKTERCSIVADYRRGSWIIRDSISRKIDAKGSNLARRMRSNPEQPLGLRSRS